MNYSDIEDKIKKISFEDFIWIIFASLSILNIYADSNVKEYLKTNNDVYKETSDDIFKFTIIVTLFIYIYFFIRNYNAYEMADIEEKQLYSIKLLGSSLLIGGILCLLYFQNKQTTFINSPAL